MAFKSSSDRWTFWFLAILLVANILYLAFGPETAGYAGLAIIILIWPVLRLAKSWLGDWYDRIPAEPVPPEEKTSKFWLIVGFVLFCYGLVRVIGYMEGCAQGL